jgi:FtsP/CotA-like multicopper oxidase with cupredoxin domain
MEMSSATYASLNPTNLDNFKNPLHLPGDDGIMGVLDASNAPVRFTAHKERVEILPGKGADLLAYHAERDGKTYVNSTIRVQSGKEFSAEFTNDLDEETTVHWHGLHVDWRMDGHPFRPVAPGATYRYAFPVQDRGGTYWYHPHPHGRTAIQTYSGLAGLFLVEDEDDQKLCEALDLRFGETDIPLLIQDRVLDESGKVVYVPGVMQKVILINLTPSPYLEVGTRIYRFRVLNGSNARNFRLAFTKAGEDELLPYRVIGTDGGLLDRPREATEVFLSPAERVDVLLDLSGFEVDEEVVLKSLPFDPMHHEHEMKMGGGMEHMEHKGHMDHMDHMEMGHHHHMDHHVSPAQLSEGSAFYLLKLVMAEKMDYSRSVPQTLSRLPQLDLSGAASRPITVSMTTDDRGMQWLINGKTHEMDEFPIVVQRGAKEIWEIYNHEKSMPHPMHIHGFQFRVLERVGTPERLAHLVVDEKGRLVTDLGSKDTVLLWPGETVKWFIDFSHDFEGEQLYMFHCHILEHETAMMVNLKVF